MWCENCSRQFDTDEKNCPECGNELIDYTPILDEDADLSGINEVDDALAGEESAEVEEIQIDIEANSQLLVTVIGEKEAKRIITLLTDNHIPAFEKLSEIQTLDELDGIEWDDEDFEDDDYDDNYYQEDVEEETLTPPETEEDSLVADETLYDIFVPEVDFPSAMSLMLENDENKDATIIDDLDEVVVEDEESDSDFIDEVYEEIEEILEEAEESIKEDSETESTEKQKGGFWNLFKK